nr:MAG TPA: hypothetical protein [Caudoviricetes sp.]
MDNQTNVGITQPTIEQVKTAYRNAENNPEIQSLLRDLYGDAIAAPVADNRPVTERIKSFGDAVAALGDEHPFVVAYNNMNEMGENIVIDLDIEAYFKLRIIVAALNEGWQPQFIEDERRYAPWFILYTNAEIDAMDDDDRAKICRVVGRSDDNANAHGGLAYADAYDDSASASSGSAARLAFKTYELAEYAGKQFIETYRDFIFATR